MGRAYELRKGRRAKRFDRLSKAFTRLGKEIAMAVKQSGPHIDANPRLRTAVNNAKGVSMPKDRIDAAIKRASEKDAKGFEEIVYEGYGPHAVAILIECATDNLNRTVGNVRSYFTRNEGTLGKTGSLDFIFSRKGVFMLAGENQSIEDLELELIDFGAEEVFEVDGNICVYTGFTDFGGMQKALETKGILLISAELQRIPNTTIDLTEEQEEEVLKLVDKFEEDDDVQAVYHNIS